MESQIKKFETLKSEKKHVDQRVTELAITQETFIPSLKDLTEENTKIKAEMLELADENQH